MLLNIVRHKLIIMVLVSVLTCFGKSCSGKSYARYAVFVFSWEEENKSHPQVFQKRSYRGIYVAWYQQEWHEVQKKNSSCPTNCTRTCTVQDYQETPRERREVNMVGTEQVTETRLDYSKQCSIKAKKANSVCVSADLKMLSNILG